MKIKEENDNYLVTPSPNITRTLKKAQPVYNVMQKKISVKQTPESLVTQALQINRAQLSNIHDVHKPSTKTLHDVMSQQSIKSLNHLEQRYKTIDQTEEENQNL